MEFGGCDVDGGHLGDGDDNAAGVLASIELAAHREAGFGGGGGDQLDNYPIADKGLGAPILADEGEEPVLVAPAYASAAATRRRPRSSRWGATVKNRSRMGSISITPTTYGIRTRL